MMRACPVGALTNDRWVYVFTPRGDVRLMPTNSTALDFAYALHTDLGHHCRAVRINQQVVPHATELRPGDLVQLLYDPFFRGPDPAWLHLTHSPHTRQKIKRGLGAVRRAIHPGRQLLQRYLESLEQHDGFVIPEPRLERHLETLAQRQGLGYTEELYEALLRGPQDSGKRLSVDKLVAYVLEAELATLVVDELGAPLLAESPDPARANRLHFCATCKPAPDAPIFVHRRMVRGRARLTVHRLAQQGAATPSQHALPGLPSLQDMTCGRLLPAAEIITGVGWRELPPSRRLTNVTLLAYDRRGLLGETLEAAYRLPNVLVTHVEASVDDEQMANVLLTVEHQAQTDALDLQATLEKLRDVLRVSLWPASITRSRARAQTLVNPYSSGNPVQSPNMFFGRQTELERVRQWLDPRNPAPIILLYGQRRVGKTSFAKMLGYHALRDMPVRPVLVDMLYARHDLTPLTLYRLMMEELYRHVYTRAATDPAYTPWLSPDFAAQPGVVFRRYVRQVLDDVKPQRLLLMLDEFNVLADECRDVGLFATLRAMTMHDFPELTLMLITHTRQFHERALSERPANQLLGQALGLEMPVLDGSAARQLVVQPLHGALVFESAVVDDLVQRTGGNAYLINLLCFLLVQRVRDEGRRYARRDDLEHALRTLWREGDTYFAFLNERAQGNPTTHALVSALAHLQAEPDQRVPLAQVARRADRLEALVQALGADRARAYPHDVAQVEQAPALFQTILADMGRLDAVIYNAGVMPKVALDEFNFAKDAQMMQVNVLGAMAWLNLAATLFERQKSGHLVGISSVAGDRGRVAAPAYTTSKAALSTFLEALRNRLTRHGVHVLTVKPGFVQTDMLKDAPRTFWVISPEQAARDILRAVQTRQQVIYTPARWGLVMLIIRHIPSFIFRRLKI